VFFSSALQLTPAAGVGLMCRHAGGCHLRPRSRKGPVPLLGSVPVKDVEEEQAGVGGWCAGDGG
jgi:hypothetical protein